MNKKMQKKMLLLIPCKQLQLPNEQKTQVCTACRQKIETHVFNAEQYRTIT